MAANAPERAMSDTGSEQESGALQRLVKERLAITGQSYRSAATAAGLPKSSLFEFATRRLKRKLDGATIAAVAAALRVPIATVEAAELEDLGVPSEGDKLPSDVATLVRMVAELDPERQRYVRALVEAMWEPSRARPS